MTQEEKSILLKDLCARLGYGVKMSNINAIHNGLDLPPITIDINDYENSNPLILINSGFIPYLRPMESMTEEERKEWFKQSRVEYDCEFHTEPTLSLCNCHLSTDWLNKKGFDYRGLIPMGLALPATEGMYN